MLEIYFEDETAKVDEEIEDLIRKLLNHAAKEEELAGEMEVSVTFMTDEDIQEVNATYIAVKCSDRCYFICA